MFGIFSQKSLQDLCPGAPQARVGPLEHYKQLILVILLLIIIIMIIGKLVTKQLSLNSQLYMNK